MLFQIFSMFVLISGLISAADGSSSDCFGDSEVRDLDPETTSVRSNVYRALDMEAPPVNRLRLSGQRPLVLPRGLLPNAGTETVQQTIPSGIQSPVSIEPTPIVDSEMARYGQEPQESSSPLALYTVKERDAIEKINKAIRGADDAINEAEKVLQNVADHKRKRGESQDAFFAVPAGAFKRKKMEAFKKDSCDEHRKHLNFLKIRKKKLEVSRARILDNPIETDYPIIRRSLMDELPLSPRSKGLGDSYKAI